MKKPLLFSLLLGVGLLWQGVTTRAEGDGLGHGAGLVTLSNGDVNGAGTRDLADAVYILNFLFGGGPPIVPIPKPDCAADPDSCAGRVRPVKANVSENAAFRDPEASFGRMIHRVSDMVGAQMFFKNCENGRYLVEIEEIELFRDPDSAYIQIGRLAGKVVWGDVPWKTVDVDRRKQFAAEG